MRIQHLRTLAYCCIAACFACLPAFAPQAQVLIVRTATMNALGESVAVYAHRVDLSRGAMLPGDCKLPAEVAIAPTLLMPASNTLLFSTATPWTGRTTLGAEDYAFISGVATSPFGRVSAQRIAAPIGWREHVAEVFQAPVSEEDLAVVLGTQLDEGGVWRGRLAVLAANNGALERRGQWPLPGPPVAAAVIPRLGRVAVVCRDAAGAGALLHIRDVLTGQQILADHRILPVGEARFGTAVADIAYAGRLIVLASGYALDAPGGDPASWLHLLDAGNGEPLADPVQISGGAVPGETALHVGGERVFAATRLPGSAFGYVHALTLQNDVLDVVRQVRLPNCPNLPLVAPAPDGGRLAVAAHDRVELWGGDEAPTRTAAFDASVNALAWTDQGLFAASGNNVVQVDPSTLETTAAVAFQSGLVDSLVVLPAYGGALDDEDDDGLSMAEEQRLGTDSADPDTDDDGIHDGLDPAPTVQSPHITVPAYITFYEETAGQELRALLMESPFVQNARYQIELSDALAPWLRAQPRSGDLPAAVYLGIDPAAYAHAGATEGTVTVRLDAAEGTPPILGSQHEVLVRVKPKRDAANRILWLTTPGEAPEYDALREFLSGAPYYFSHNTAAPDELPVLRDYTLVAISARRALEGTITRQALIDYVANGGSLLLILEQLDDVPVQGFARWLSPLGVDINVEVGIDEPFLPQPTDSFARYWDGTARRAASLTARPPAEAHVTTRRQASPALLATVLHGRGRIAVLASPEPLANPWGSNGSGRFAAGLIRWVTKPGLALSSDYDGDGLRNLLEDRNSNGAVDPGETDPLDADTDRDGIPDGEEDLNRNGQLDEGETSPLNPDTDGDGIWDGADIHPVPPIEAPRIARVEPATAPAEGGVDVLVSGRNFAPNSGVWFGERRAVSARSLGSEAILAQVPPSESLEGGAVDVRVENPAVGLAGTLPGGFRYTPVSGVLLTLENIARSTGQYGGAISVRMEGGPDVAVGSIALRLDVLPPGAVEWGRVTPGALAKYAGRNVVSGPAPDGGLWINLSEGNRPHSSGELAVVQWQPADPARAGASARVGWSRVLAPNGYPLEVRASQARINLPWPQAAREEEAEQDAEPQAINDE